MRNNDRGGYTVPTHGLYPFQWSWDSAITALGWQRFDEARAWEEAATMFRGQWDNGMLPHILFHKEAGSYFPGPDVWGGGESIPSSAISQPPIWATALRMLHENSGDPAGSEAHLRELLEQGFEVAVVKDATAAAKVPEGDGYQTAMVNFRFLANTVWTTAEAASAIRETHH